MIITITRSALLQLATHAHGVCDRKTTQNILSHVLVETDGARLRYTATDFDVVITGTVPCEATVPGRMALAAATLLQVAKTLPDLPITLTGLENHWVELLCGSSRFKLAGLPPDDFPEQKAAGDLRPFTVPTRLLLALIQRSAFSVSHDETRPSLNGVFFRAEREDTEVRLAMVSTDGHRLSRSEALGGDAGQFATAEAIIHGRALGEFAKLLDDADSCTVAFAGANVILAVGDVTIQARQLDESFPDYTKVIPKNPTIRLDLDAAEFGRTIKRVAVITSAKTNIIRFTVSTGKLALGSQNPELGEGTATMPVEYEGDDVAIGFNYKYLLDVLAIIAGDRIRLALSDQYSPGLITSPDDEGSLFVVMPMRV